MKATFNSFIITLLLGLTLVNASPVPQGSEAAPPPPDGAPDYGTLGDVTGTLGRLLSGVGRREGSLALHAKRQDTPAPSPAEVVTAVCTRNAGVDPDYPNGPPNSPITSICQSDSDPETKFIQLCSVTPLEGCPVPEN